MADLNALMRGEATQVVPPAAPVRPEAPPSPKPIDTVPVAVQTQSEPKPASTTLPPESEIQVEVSPETQTQPTVPAATLELNAAIQPEPEYLIAEWIADSRVSKPRTREYYSSLAVIVLLISLILFFAGQGLLIFVVVSFLFVSYVLASVRADSIVNQITTYGIRYRGKLHYWHQLGRFWSRMNRGVEEIHIEAPSNLGNEIILLPANSNSPVAVESTDVIDILSRYLINQPPAMTQLDRWVHWLEEKFPLESTRLRK